MPLGIQVFLFTELDLAAKAQVPRAIWGTWWYLRYLPGAGSMALDLWEQESERDT